MPKNSHFNWTTDINESSLISDLKKEAIEIYGTNVWYIKRESESYNQILGEDPNQKFKDASLICVYPESIEKFGSNNEFLAKFGFSLNDTTDFLVHKDEFKEFVANQEYPEVGDLIYWIDTKRLFKINFVDVDYQFYQLGKNSVYQMQCELFKYSSETIDTSIEEIDIFNEFANDDNVESDPAEVDNQELQTRSNKWIVEE